MTSKTTYFARYRVTKYNYSRFSATAKVSPSVNEMEIKKLLNIHPVAFEHAMNEKYNKELSLSPDDPMNFDTIKEEWDLIFFEQVPYTVYAKFKDIY